MKNYSKLSSNEIKACVFAQILEMPYKGKDLSMLIFLPNEIEDDTTGLEKVGQTGTYSTQLHNFKQTNN